MERYGIVCVQTVQYNYKGWKYAHLADAVRQARRDVALNDATPGSAR